jgi:class 3 adenylate cyclase
MGVGALLAGPLRRGGTFLVGTPGELALLFGRPEPLLPPGDPDGSGGARIAVECGARLREGCARWLGFAARSLEAGPRGGLAAAGSSDGDAERAYHDLVAETLRAVAQADRRQGLVNLFWVAHSREVAEELERFCGARGRDPRLRYRLYPLLAGLLRRADAASRAAAGRPQKSIQDFRRGEETEALVRSVIEDQLTLTEPDPRAFDPARALAPGNGRFAISAAAFVEIRDALREAAARGVARGDRALLEAVREHCPVALPAAADAPAAWDRFVFAEPLREALLADLDGAPARLRESRALRAELAPGRGFAELLAAFADVTRCLRRAEALHELRGALDFVVRSQDRGETRERYREGRLFRFGTGDAVQSAVRTATILFADLRGFTRASDGAVSEGELARELYEIFDPAALIVQRFGGLVDKYIGDGFMATFCDGAGALEQAVAAVRTAVVLQQVLARQRRLGRTAFRMGVSLHAGRVAVARFLLDSRHSSTTVIGRHVNLAGRLSASDGALDEAGAGHRRVGDVSLGPDGRLVNLGIVVSGPLLATLRAGLACEHFSENGIEGERWYDHDLCLWLHLGYVGEVRMRGLEAAAAVYSLVFAEPALRAGTP